MYRIKSGDTVGYSESIVHIRLSDNGSYIPCDQNEAEGVCVKTPITYETEDGEIRTVSDTVFKTKDNGLHGTEPSAEVEELLGAVALADADEVVNILLGGEQA